MRRAVVVIVLAGCAPHAAPEPEEPEVIVELPPPKPRKPMPTEAMFEAAWVIAGDPPPLAMVPDPCFFADAREYQPDLVYCNPPPPAVIPCPEPPDPSLPSCQAEYTKTKSRGGTNR